MFQKISFATLLIATALTSTIIAMEGSQTPINTEIASMQAIIEVANQSEKFIRAFGEVEERLLEGNLGRLFSCFPGEDTTITLPMFWEAGTTILQSRLEIPGYLLKVTQQGGGYSAQLRAIVERGKTEPVSEVDFHSKKQRLVLIVTREGTATLMVRQL